MGDVRGRRKVNREFNRDLAHVARFRPHAVSFLCECGAPTCHERVHLRVAAFEALVADGGLVVASGHHVLRTTA